MCLEYHIFHHPGPTFILVGVSLCALLRGTDNGECLKMAVGHQKFSTSFARAVNHVAEDELEEDLLQLVMATTLEEELSLLGLNNVAGYFSLAEEEAEFQYLKQELKPKTSPVELKQLPPELQYFFLNGDHEIPVIISDYYLIPSRLTTLIRWKILDSVVNEVSEALSVHVVPLTIRIVVVPAGVTVLFRLHNPPHSWTGTVGPSLPSFTIAPCMDSLLCYRLIRRPKSILQDNPKYKVRVCIYTIAFELSYSSLG
jgi:hypothetical protein